MRVKALQLNATTVEASQQFGPSLREMFVKNYGNSNVWIDFDKPIDTNNAYLLEAGETISVGFDFINLYFKSVAGTSKLYVMKVLQ